MADRLHPPAARLALPASLVLAALLGGCYTQPKHTTSADLVRLEQLLPGRYDQRASAASGSASAPSIEVRIVTIQSLMLGSPAFYLRATDARDPDRMPEQRIVVFKELGKQLVETQWLLSDPARWREGASSPELFTSLQPPDLKPLRGCSLVWTREGERFTGEGDPDKCPAGAAADTDSPLAALRVELSPEELVLGSVSPKTGPSGSPTGPSSGSPSASASGSPGMKPLHLQRRVEE